MSNPIWIEEATCSRCNMRVPVGFIEAHRTADHPRLKQSLVFRGVCPVCGGRTAQQRFELFAGTPIENTCVNGHEYVSHSLVAGPIRRR